MRAVLQRVRSATVSVESNQIASIEYGLLIYLGIGLNDSEELSKQFVEKIVQCRIFPDEENKMNRSIHQINGQVCVVSQFTLYANCKKGNRPNFTEAAHAALANELYNYSIDCFKSHGISTTCGQFGANMQIRSENDGPVTIFLDSDHCLSK